MYCRTGLLRLLAVTLSILTAGGCSRFTQKKNAAKAEPERLAILRFENLSGDASADWMGRALSEILTAELTGAPGITVITPAAVHARDRNLGVRPVSAPGVSAERSGALAAGADRLGYGYYSIREGKLRVRLMIEDVRAGSMTETAASAAAGADGVFGAANRLARQLAPRITPFATHIAACIHAYADALETHDPAETAADLERAIAADADFGPPYRMLAELDMQHGDRAGAAAVMERAAARGDAIAPIERARIGVLSADLHGDPAARERALAALAKLEPGNARTWQTLAETAMSHHHFKAAEDAYQAAVKLEPDNAALLNSASYAAAYAGDFDAGAATLKRYRQLRPNDPNAVDSTGDLNFLNGHYPEAEALYLEANKMNSNFEANGAGGDLFKAAMSRAMAGDIDGADGFEKQFLAERAKAHDPGTELRELDWLWLTGRRQQAYRQMQAKGEAAEKSSDKAAASLAFSQMALWSLMAGDRVGALELAQRAALLATPATATPVLVARFLAQPSASADEWTARAARFVPNPAQAAVKDEMLAFALLLDGKVKDAAAPLERIYDASGIATNEGLPVLVAWTKAERGDEAGAAELLKLTPVPPMSGVGTFMPLYFPRILQLRSVVAAKAGNADEAKRDLELYKKLTGAQPVMRGQSSDRPRTQLP